MNSIIFLAESVNPLTDITRTFGVNWWAFLSQLISFVIVILLLRQFAYGPILAILEERRKKIADGLESAAKSKVELANAQKTASEVISKANQDAQRIIEEGKAAAKIVQERETQRAMIEAEQIRAKAREDARIEGARVLGEAKREIARLVIDATSKVTGKVLNEEDQTRLRDEAVRVVAA